MTTAALSALGALQTEAPNAVSALQRSGAASAAADVQGQDFASVLAEVAAASIRTVEKGEAAALAGLQGGASVQQVVEAVMSAEQTLQTAIAIRDKVIGAYQEISRMAI